MDSSWRMAVTATRHCLTGCAIGEVLGMVIGTVAGLSDTVTVVLAIALAFVFGYALTVRSTLHAGLRLGPAVRVALAADTVSIGVMELVDNAVIVAVPGAMDSGLVSWLFWLTLAFSLAVAFVVTVPVNRIMINRGLGHAVVHQLHAGHSPGDPAGHSTSPTAGHSTSPTAGHSAGHSPGDPAEPGDSESHHGTHHQPGPSSSA